MELGVDFVVEVILRGSGSTVDGSLVLGRVGGYFGIRYVQVKERLKHVPL
jgi:hypothetical protein